MWYNRNNHFQQENITMDERLENATTLKKQIDVLRPLDPEQLRALWPMLQNDSIFYTYTTNAIEGNTLTLGETTVVLVDGITIGGKTIGEHLDAVNGQRAYLHMLDLAQKHAPLNEEAIKDLHAYVVGNNPLLVGGLYRNDQRFIYGSRHVPPAEHKVRYMMKDIMAEYVRDSENLHPVAAAAKLHYNLVAIHPFPDFNGRTARLAMNLSLVQNGYPTILIQPGAEKATYLTALESSHMHPQQYWQNRNGNPKPFVTYIGEIVQKRLVQVLGILQEISPPKLTHPQEKRNITNEKRGLDEGR